MGGEEGGGHAGGVDVFLVLSTVRGSRRDFHFESERRLCVILIVNAAERERERERERARQTCWARRIKLTVEIITNLCRLGKPLPTSLYGRSPNDWPLFSAFCRYCE